MNTVAHATPRPWDGRRLVRFLTSLAMLALAVTLQLPAPAITADAPSAAVETVPASVPVSVPASVSAETPAAVSPEADEADAGRPGRQAPRVTLNPPLPAAASAEIITTPRHPIAGETPRSAGPRAPPAV
ncbi:hypothetical protein [Actinoplanes sp. GCM10030250]|uniref:hypothetical protein n=1 Tax=Actinoplanes sp. GCM10030250 TaxID=3273376 RepID=UPI0036139811